MDRMNWCIGESAVCVALDEREKRRMMMEGNEGIFGGRLCMNHGLKR